MRVVHLGLIAAIAGLFSSACGGSSGSNETVFVGGTVRTMVRARPVAEAVAVRDGRIVAVGTRKEVLASVGPHSTTVDLEGRTLLPGFIEPHTHLDQLAIFATWANITALAPGSSVAKVEQTLRDAVAAQPEGGWALAFGWDPMSLPDLPRADRTYLDGFSTTKKIAMLIQSEHTLYVNTLAMKASGAWEQDPPPDVLQGGVIRRDAQGVPTGLIEEGAGINWFFSAASVPLPGGAEMRQNLEYALDCYVEKGITSLAIPGLAVAGQGIEAMLAEMARSPEARVRIFTYANPVAGIEYPGEIVGDKRYRMVGSKYWYDGSPYSGSMYVYDPYRDTDLTHVLDFPPPPAYGRANYVPKSQLLAAMTPAWKAGAQLSVHTQGDHAVSDVLDVFEELLGTHPRDNHRSRLEHLAQADEATIERAAKLGVALSFHMNHIYYYGRVLRYDLLAGANAERLMPLAWAKKHGASMSFHSDTPMYPPDPLLTVRTAVTRLVREGPSGESPFVLDLSAEEGGPLGIELDDAMEAITASAAYQLFAEDEIGSIEVGKQADLTVLENDPFETLPEDLHLIPIVETWVGGRRIPPVTQSRAPCI